MDKTKKTVTIVWWGIGGLASAILLAREGHKVSVYEKNECLGGRASIMHKDGYTFDMWPSRYLMPDVFEEFFKSIDEDIHDRLDLKQLSPSYRVFYDYPHPPTHSTLKGHQSPSESRKNEIVITTYDWQICCSCIWLFWFIGSEVTRRDGVLAIIKNTSNGKFLFQKKKRAYDVITLCGWWIEEWESKEETILREIREETWLQNPKLVCKLGDTSYLNYRKWKENLFWSNDFYYIEVESDENINQVSEEELSVNENIWLEKKDVSKNINFYSHLIWWFRYLEFLDGWCDFRKSDEKFIDYCAKLGFSSGDNLLGHSHNKNGYVDNENRHTKSISLQYIDIYADKKMMASVFESMEAWSGKQFLTFLERSKEQYEIGMEFCKKNYDSLFDFFRWDIMRKGMKLNIRTTIDKYVARYFKSQIIQKIMQYSSVFLGTAPKSTPALYNIMSHADYNMWVRYPKWGLHQIAQVLYKIGLKHGVEYHLNTEIIGCEIEKEEIISLQTKEYLITSDIYVINADMAWFETSILPAKAQTYTKSYRDKKIFAPSGFIIFAGINKKLAKLDHHNLYFCEDWDKNFWQIFDSKELPSDPSIYVSKISHTDSDMAPEWCENLFILVPIPNGIEITDNQKELYKNQIWKIVEQMAGEDIVWHIEVEEIFTVNDFASRYHARNGTALGLAHPIMQTAVFRPNNISKKLDNLFYVWHNTNPGIGVPMVLISATLVAERIKNNYN